MKHRAWPGMECQNLTESEACLHEVSKQDEGGLSAASSGLDGVSVLLWDKWGIYMGVGGPGWGEISKWINLLMGGLLLSELQIWDKRKLEWISWCWIGIGGFHHFQYRTRYRNIDVNTVYV